MRLALVFFLTALSTVQPSYAQSVLVSRRPVTYTRKRPTIDHKRTFKITYPVIKAAAPRVSAKIMNELDYFSIFNFKLAEEISTMQWLEDADFDIKYNDKGILSVAIWIEGSGAYPDGVTKYLTFDVNSGQRANAMELFTLRGKLAAAIDVKMQAAIKEAAKTMREDTENADLDESEVYGKYKFTTRATNNFYVTRKGVTFVYQYNFPHAVKALEPANEYTMTWKELKPFIRRDGLLTSFVR